MGKDSISAVSDVKEKVVRPLVEVEGPLGVIPDVARSLGLDPAAALKDSYSLLALKYLAKSKKQARRHAEAAAAVAGTAAAS